MTTEAQKRANRNYSRSAKGKAYRRAYQRSSRGILAIQKYKNSAKGAETLRRHDQQRHQKIRETVFSHYGTICVRCGFSDQRALSIDHIDGGGTQHRKSIGKGNLFYRWLAKHGFPEGFQTLCMNCQFIKRYENDELNKSRKVSVTESLLPLFDHT
jgi:hypothetical protein